MATYVLADHYIEGNDRHLVITVTKDNGEVVTEHMTFPKERSRVLARRQAREALDVKYKPANREPEPGIGMVL